ncbi:hypothetical protein EJ04DRAFT_554958 [Polyplosphaeria fusca]|uniref:Uncharacterized protein n=1 Tax=Polyplosphaeria fusca TaxID=682080 RepID=A0A9P4QU54_9PLEO|nr:hypothetical protein EJ04DRAFT_554958 [Polyplosphaeria fusca]
MSAYCAVLDEDGGVLEYIWSGTGVSTRIPIPSSSSLPRPHDLPSGYPSRSYGPFGALGSAYTPAYDVQPATKLPPEIQEADGGSKARRFIKSRTDSIDVERLGPRCRRIVAAHRSHFFSTGPTGRVFKMLWAERAG